MQLYICLTSISTGRLLVCPRLSPNDLIIIIFNGKKGYPARSIFDSYHKKYSAHFYEDILRAFFKSELMVS
jgi:hypothetical protein